jgi:hypothetical protein
MDVGAGMGSDGIDILGFFFEFSFFFLWGYGSRLVL